MFSLNTLYLASILFTWLKFTCVNVRSQKRVNGNPPLRQQTNKLELYEMEPSLVANFDFRRRYEVSELKNLQC